MLLTHPTILSISIHGVEYRPDDGVFDMPDSAAAIAMADFGMTEAKSGRPKRAKAGGPPSARAKPRSRKPKAKPQGEGINWPVAGSYTFTPSFCAPQPYINYNLQNTSCKMETAAASGSASCIYHISDRIWPYRTDSESGEAVRPEPSSAPSNSLAWHEHQTGPSTGAYLLRSKHWPGDLMHPARGRGVGTGAGPLARRYHRAEWVPGGVICPARTFRARVRGPTTCLVMRRVVKSGRKLSGYKIGCGPLRGSSLLRRSIPYPLPAGAARSIPLAPPSAFALLEIFRRAI
ncbi:MAG: hypothetical protein LBC63_08945 [Holophagales bacterium]|jgi:hypothetical protein|nr:hypothetical protein [Holophagales bacterium]